jgi:hypothetical protein
VSTFESTPLIPRKSSTASLSSMANHSMPNLLPTFYPITPISSSLRYRRNSPQQRHSGLVYKRKLCRSMVGNEKSKYIYLCDIGLGKHPKSIPQVEPSNCWPWRYTGSPARIQLQWELPISGFNNWPKSSRRHGSPSHAKCLVPTDWLYSSPDNRWFKRRIEGGQQKARRVHVGEV